MALSTGSLLADRYEITAPIATGGMGEVWKARDQVLDRIVAAKVLRSEYTGDPNFLARFRNEARHTAALTHPNIASVYDYGETVTTDGPHPGQRVAYLVMEYVEGKPLVTILHEEGKLPVDWTLHVLGQAADGLSAAHHAGVVHRDIKPGNLIVRPDGVVKLTDFGIARARDATPLTRTGMVVGTAQYLSPEQAQGFEVTAASDVYSLGVVGYECLTGGRPFDGTSQVAVALAHINRQPPPLPANVPPAVRLLIERALAKDPADRFPDGAAFAAAIRSVASGNGVSPASPAAGPAPTPPYPVGAAPTAQTEVVDDLADSRTQVLGAASAGGAAVTGARTSVGAMPPLRRTDDDDEDGRHAPPPTDDGRRRRPWAWLVAGLLLLALVGGGLWALSSSGDDGATGTDATPTTAAPTTATSAAPGTFFVATGDYVGDNVEDVADLLRAADLQVETDEASAAQLAAVGQPLDEGDVVTTDPANTNVSPGDTVTLYYAAADYAPDTGDGGSGTGEDEAPATPTTQAPPRTTAAPAPTTANNPRPSSSAPATSSSAAASSSEAEGSAVQEPELPAEPAPERPDQGGNGRPQADAESQQQAVQGTGPTA